GPARQRRRHGTERRQDRRGLPPRDDERKLLLFISLGGDEASLLSIRFQADPEAREDRRDVEENSRILSPALRPKLGKALGAGGLLPQEMQIREFRLADYDSVLELWLEAGLLFRPGGRKAA